MLSRRIVNISINCRKLIIAHKLKPIGSLCQVEKFTGKYHAKLMSSKLNKDHRIQLTDSTSSSIVLELLEFNFNADNLNRSDIIRALTKFVQLCKQENRSPEKLVYEDFFRNLCDLINVQSDNLTISEAMQIINLLQQLNVPSSWNIIPRLFQHVDKELNTVSFVDYNKIMEIITKMSSIPTTESIKNQLIEKFIMNTCSKLDLNNFEHLIEALKFACFYVQDEEILELITNSFNNIDFETQSPQSILSLMRTLSTLKKYSTTCDKILIPVQNAFAENIKEINNKDILSILKEISLKVKKYRLNQFYKETLFNKVAEKLISTQCSLEEALQCLKAFNMAKHSSKELLSYMSNEIYTEVAYNNKNIRDAILMHMLEGFADSKYKPFCWETFLTAFKTNNIIKYDTETLIYQATYLASLDIYEPEMLGKIFESNLNFEKSSRTLHHSLLRLYQKLKTTPNYTGPLPSQTQVDSFEVLMRTLVEFPLYAHLKEVFGGPEFVKTNIRTKLYHQIDHVLAFQPDGIPIPINVVEKQEKTKNIDGKLEYLENLNIPENCQVVAVILTPWVWYSRNTKEILGKFNTYINTLETLSCRVVTVSDKEWESIPRNVRSDFLMNIIRSKLENDEREASLVN